MPRDLALDLLSAVLGKSRPLDEAFDSHPRLAGLETRDRAFARNLATTAIRHLGEIDAVIGHCLERPLAGKAASTMNILRLGVCQLLFLGTPSHAAVDTSVRIAASADAGAYKKLVNAVLRRAGREGRAILDTVDAARVNTPDWLWDSWIQAHGEKTCRAIATANMVAAPLDITVKTDPGGWAEKLGARLLPTGSLRIDAAAGPVRGLPGYDDGAWWVQDAAAVLAVKCLGEVGGKNVIDLCAAPGGKTAQLAAAGATVTALDRSGRRLERLAENMDRLGLGVEIVTDDALGWRPPEPADAVLLDAPCSATGTIRRHPDVPYRRGQADVGKLAALQAKLLAAAADMVAPGGVLIYCVCSLQAEEGAALAGAFAESGAPVEAVALEAPPGVNIAGLITPEGYLRTFPDFIDGGCDGFFVAKFRRL